MSRTSPPCSSSEQRGRRHVPPGFDGRHRAPPYRTRLLSGSREIRLGLFLRGRCETLPSPLLHLLDDLLQFLGHRWNRLARELWFAIGSFSHDDVEFSVLVVFRREVIAEMSPAALFSLKCREGDNFGNGQQVVQIE